VVDLLDATSGKNALETRIETLMFDLVGIYSATGTGMERDVEVFYRAWFASMDYFKTRRDQTGFFKIPGDHLGRTIPWCLLKGEGRETVVLLHHYDVVDTEDYKSMQPIAVRPYELMAALGDGKARLDPEARKDLESGDWLFGRGAADMKGGAAIQMALFERYAKEGNFKGNLLLIGLPDEENLSAGGRAAPTLLKELKGKFGLDYLLAMNGEPTDRKRGCELPKLHVGSIGKIMPLIYARGVLAHAGSVYDGLNPIKIMAEAVRRLDLNPKLIDDIDGVASPAPTFLYLKDRKGVYDVSLPISACGYMSVMFLRRSPEEIMGFVRDQCAEAFDAAIADVRKSYDAYAKVHGAGAAAPEWRANVKMYADLCAEALRDSGESFAADLKSFAAEMKERVSSGAMSMVDASIAAIERTLRHVKDSSPCIVIALAPPYYPVVGNKMLGSGADRVNRLCEGIIERARNKFGDEYVEYYIVGMSDLSYFMRNPANGEEGYMRDNLLLWGDLYEIPFDALAEISMPVLNIGPWGKDFHKFTERVYKEDLFRRTPDLVAFAVETILK
jgi:arginine utilization protein RocB